MNWKLQENVIGESETNLLISFLREAPRLTQSDNVQHFEAAFSEWQGCRYSVFVNSGSSANILLVSALKELMRWSEGDEIIVPARNLANDSNTDNPEWSQASFLR